MKPLQLNDLQKNKFLEMCQMSFSNRTFDFPREFGEWNFVEVGPPEENSKVGEIFHWYELANTWLVEKVLARPTSYIGGKPAYPRNLEDILNHFYLNCNMYFAGTNKIAPYTKAKHPVDYLFDEYIKITTF